MTRHFRTLKSFFLLTYILTAAAAEIAGEGGAGTGPGGDMVVTALAFERNRFFSEAWK